jgi:hypothetical protein
MRAIKLGSTDQSVTIRIVDSTDGTPETGVVAATSGLALYYRRQGAARVALTALNDLAGANSAHNDGGLFHLGDGYYRVDPQDAAFASGSADVVIEGTATGMVVIGAYHPLVAYDPADAAGLGLSRIDAAVSSRSTLTAQGVWEYATRTLSAISDSAGVTTLLDRLTATRAGYLDNLANAIATAAENAAAVWAAVSRTITGTVSLGSGERVKLDASQPDYAPLKASDYTAPPTVGAIADAVWDETAADHETAGSTGEALADGGGGGGASAADIWGYSSRTLTMTAAQIADVLAGDTINIRQADKVTIPLVGIGSLVGRQKLYFTVKLKRTDSDEKSLLQIEETAGAVYINGVPASAGSLCSLTVTNANTGAVTIVLKSGAAKLLPAGEGYVYDVKMITSTDNDAATKTEGEATVTGAVTRATTA